MTELVTVYYIKYALTDGITQLQGHIDPSGYFREKITHNKVAYLLEKKDYQLSREDAIAEFEKRRAAKIASLRKQIAKLEQMTPKIKEGWQS